MRASVTVSVCVPIERCPKLKSILFQKNPKEIDSPATECKLHVGTIRHERTRYAWSLSRGENSTKRRTFDSTLSRRSGASYCSRALPHCAVTQERETKSSLNYQNSVSLAKRDSVSSLQLLGLREQTHDSPAVSPAGKTSTQPDATREVSVLHHMMSVLAVVTKQNSTPVLSIRCFLDWSVVGSW